MPRCPDFTFPRHVLGMAGLLQASVRHGVRRLLFASTGGALYGDAEVTPTPEDYATLAGFALRGLQARL